MTPSTTEKESIEPMENTILFVAEFCQTSPLLAFITPLITKDGSFTHKNLNVASVVIVSMDAES